MIHPSFQELTRRERPPLYPVQDRRIQFIPKTKTREIYFKGERGDRWAPHHHHPHHATAAVPAEAYTTRTLRQRVHRASHPSCTTPTTPKQTNVTLHPAADGSPRITSPRILLTNRRAHSLELHHHAAVARRWSEVHHVQHHVLYHFPKFDGFFY